MKIIGHRGARGLAPENTIAAIEKALEYGVDEIEIDIRVTKDLKPVLVHNRRAKYGNRRLMVASNSYRALQAFKPDLVLLGEAIQAINKRVPLMIEVKPGVPIEPVITTVQKFLDNGWQASDFSFGSFSQTTLRALHRAMPDIQNVVIERFLGSYGIHRARQIHGRRVSINHYFLNRRFLKRAQRDNFEICVYTLNDQAKAQAWAERGLDGVITDRPDLYTTK